MIKHSVVKQVHRSAEDTFSVIGTGVFENHPKWEREVLEIRRITDGPVGVGSRAVMVRRDFGRTSETEYELTDFEQDRRIAAHHPDASMDFRISFEITPVDADSCTVEIDVAAQPLGWTRVLEPVMRLAMPKQGRRIADSMVEVIEASPRRD